MNRPDKHTYPASTLIKHPKKQAYKQFMNKPLGLYTIPALQEFKASFLKEVQAPIDMQTSIHKSKSPQRCLQHNNVITLYCVNDAQTLCVTCMYQNNIHKKHKVIPLNRSSKELKAELDASLKAVEAAVSMADAIEADSINSLERTQKQFPQILKAIQNFYGGLIRGLQQKRDEQIQHIQDTWARLRHQYANWGHEMQKIKVYVMQRVGQMYERPAEEHLVFNRNVAASLATLNKLIRPQMCPNHVTTYMDQIKRFKLAQEQLRNKLIFTSPFEVKVERSSSRKKMSMKTKNQSFTHSQEPYLVNETGQLQSPSEQKTISRVKKTMKSIEKQEKMKHLSPQPARRKPQLRVSAHKSPSRSKSQLSRNKDK